MINSVKIIIIFVSICILSSCNNEDEVIPTPVPEVNLPTEGLIVHYRFDGNANDSSGNANHGVIRGASLVSNRYGVDNKAYSFDGVDDQVVFGYDNDFDNLAISFSFWINFKELKSAILGNDVVDNIQSGIWFSVGQSTETQNKMGLGYGNGGSPRPSSRKSFVSNEVLETDKWYHIVGIIESLDNIRIIINGNETEGVYSGTASSFSHSMNSGKIGRVWDPNSFFSGKIDDFRIFNRVLSQNEIEALAAE